MNERQAAFFAEYGPRFEQGVALARYTAARIGGPAEYLWHARDEDETATVLGAAWAAGVPVTTLGGGANVLISDAGVRGLVVVCALDAVAFLDPAAQPDGAACAVGAGHSLTVLARRCAAAGLAGFEWAASVPGTVGGAVVNNAGAHGGDMAGNLVSARVLVAEAAAASDADASTRTDAPHTLSPADLAYAYRTSSLKAREDRRCFVLSARLRLQPDDADAVRARIDANTAHRRQTQPAGASLGSIFKNPPGDYAGRLIEACGLKGMRIGAAQVSPVHGNFFVNTGRATAADYAALVATVRAAVFEQTGVLLHPEIEMLGFAPGEG